jgi:hypothetical protein
MSAELDFTEDRAARVEYVMDQMVLWRENAVEAAGRYLDYLMDADYDLYCEADDALATLEAYYLGN